jgi:hypothetical protein
MRLRFDLGVHIWIERDPPLALRANLELDLAGLIPIVGQTVGIPLPLYHTTP